jgi:hypothetical protein
MSEQIRPGRRNFRNRTLASATRWVYPDGIAFPALGDPMVMGIEQALVEIGNRTWAN